MGKRAPASLLAGPGSPDRAAVGSRAPMSNGSIGPTRRDLPRWAFLPGVAAVAVPQIAVQSPDLAGLLANLRHEGHPPLAPE